MITKTLKEFASPIISKAMATGARSSSTTTTNYGGIGDAMFKKAQLDMNMAQLTFDMKSKNLDREAGMVNMRADNSLKILEIEDRYQQMVNKVKADSQDMGGMEKALGTLQGVASGAMTGFAAGNVPGAIIGGVAGGAVAADNYYSGKPGDEKRADGMRNQEMMGKIANLSGTLRGMYDGYKGKEAFGKTAKNLGDLAKVVQSLGPGQARDQAIAEYNTKTSAAQAELSRYYGPQEVNTMMEGMRKGAPAIFSNDPVTRDKALLAQNGVAAAADPLLQSSSPEGRSRLKQYHADNNAILGRLYGSDKEHNMSNAEFSQWAGGINPQLGMEATSMYNGGISSVRQAPPSGMGTGGAQSANQVHQPQAPNPSQGRTIQQAPVVSQAPSSMVDNSQSFMLNNPGVGGGVVMDDGMGFLRDPVGSIQKMNEQGAAAAEVFKAKETPSYSDDARNIMAQNMGDAKPTAPGAASAPPAESQRLKDWKEGKELPEVAAKKFEEVKVKSAEVDKQINASLEEAKASQTLSVDGLAKAEQIRNAQDGLSKMEKLVGKVPNDSQVKAMAAQVYLKGLQVGKAGQALGATIGLSGGIAGVIAGNVVGDTLGTVMDGQAVGKGSQRLVSSILSKDEIAAINEYARVSELAVPAMVKTADGNMVTNPEAEAMKNNFFNYGMSKDQQLQAIVTLKENLAAKAGSIAEFSRAGKAQYDYKTKMPIDYRANSQINKANDEAYNREMGRRRGAAQDSQDDVPFFDGGYIPLN